MLILQPYREPSAPSEERPDRVQLLALGDFTIQQAAFLDALERLGNQGEPLMGVVMRGGSYGMRDASSASSGML